jgi:hypothetical protein
MRNRVEYFKSFVYGRAKWVEDDEGARIEVAIEARKNGRPICSGCGQPAAGYDRLAERRFEFVPLWGIAVFFVYAMRRVECPACGVKVEQVPWCDGKNQLTTSYRWFLASWAKRLSWQGVACAFGTSWPKNRLDRRWLLRGSPKPAIVLDGKIYTTAPPPPTDDASARHIAHRPHVLGYQPNTLHDDAPGREAILLLGLCGVGAFDGARPTRCGVSAALAAGESLDTQAGVLVE